MTGTTANTSPVFRRFLSVCGVGHNTVISGNLKVPHGEVLNKQVAVPLLGCRDPSNLTSVLMIQQHKVGAEQHLL